MITAQTLYARREERGEIDDNDLAALFEAVCGDPTPRGRTEISPPALRYYATKMRSRYAAHKADGGVGGAYLLDIALFIDSVLVTE